MTKMLIAGLLLLSQGLGIAAELQVPEQFDVLVVNGKEFPTTLALNKSVPLVAGRNVVILEFDQIYDADFGDSHDRVRSAPFALVFSAAVTDQLQLRGPELSSGADAKRYATAPTVQVIDSKKQVVAVQQLPVTELNGMLLADNSTNAAASKPPVLVSDIADKAATPTSAPTASPAPPAAAVAVANTPDALSMLAYWWQQASAEQRAEFLRQISH